MTTSRKCWLTFEGPCRDMPCIWKMSRRHPEVSFDIRQASVSDQVGIMAVRFDGSEAEVEKALDYLRELGVRVDPVEGGSLVAG